MSDRAPTPDELLEASALAQALEGEFDGESGRALPQDVWETAAMLRYGLQPELDYRKEQEILRVALASMPLPSKRHWFYRLLWLAPALAMLIVALLWMPSAPQVPTRLPGPDAVLIEEQAAVAQGKKQALSRFRQRMQTYRLKVLSSMVERYGGDL